MPREAPGLGRGEELFGLSERSTSCAWVKVLAGLEDSHFLAEDESEDWGILPLQLIPRILSGEGEFALNGEDAGGAFDEVVDLGVAKPGVVNKGEPLSTANSITQPPAKFPPRQVLEANSLGLRPSHAAGPS